MNKALRDYLKAEKRMGEYVWNLWTKLTFSKEPFFKVKKEPFFKVKKKDGK